MVGRLVPHVPDPDEFKAALVHPEDVVASLAEEVALSDLFPSLQVPETAVLVEVPNQVNKAELFD